MTQQGPGHRPQGHSPSPPGRRAAGDLIDRLDLAVGQARRELRDVVADPAALNDDDTTVFGLLLDRPTFWRPSRDHAERGHREADLLGQQAARTLGLVAAVADVRHSLTVDHEGVTTDPDAGVGVVLGVHRQHAARADQDVVDVRATVADLDGVDDPPLRTELRKLNSDCLLPVGTDPPRALVCLRID